MYAAGASHNPPEGKGAGALTFYFQTVPPFDPEGERICIIPASIVFVLPQRQLVRGDPPETPNSKSKGAYYYA